MINLSNSMEFDDNVIRVSDAFHGVRVAKLASMLCNSMNISDFEKEEIVLSAVLHDIGKTTIDRNILNKPSKLNNREWQYIKLHPKYGSAIAALMGYSTNISKNILYHHENCDGTGYPIGLKEEYIPIGAAIVRICDSYDAMRTKRPYKKKFSHKEAIAELLKENEKYKNDLLMSFIKLDFHGIAKYHR